MKGERFNKFKNACERYLLTICRNRDLTNRAFIFIDKVTHTEDKIIFELMMQVDLENLYRSPEFNRQLRLRMKFYNLKWINKNG